MQTILTVIQVFLSLGLIVLILIQHGKGADAGAAFGSGASATVFGARGSGSFLTRATAILATIFFLTSMALAYYATRSSEPPTLMDGIDDTTVVIPGPVSPTTDVPAIPGATATPFAPSDVPAVTVLPDGAPIEGDAAAMEALTEALGTDPGDDIPLPVGEDTPTVEQAVDVSVSAPDTSEAVQVDAVIDMAEPEATESEQQSQ
jgi:preprotein translocase subunit SecG